jgi:hypothetical protein
VRVDAIAIRLRRRSNMEAADLGVRMCQSAARDVYACFLAVAVPVFAFALATVDIALWLPIVLIWWSKAWLDRTILFVLSRAAFGQRTSLAELWNAKRDVWWRQLFLSLTVRRLSPWRSFTQAVYQLEGVPFSQRGRRIRQIRLGKAGSALGITAAYSTVTLAFTVALLSLAFWFAPTGSGPDTTQLFTEEGERVLALASAIAYGLVVCAIEPFYVASGFAMYLNRRVELEAWDIEQEFRRAFGN